jgi:hypothetical protein
MKILVACEFSGIVRDAFIAKGHDAWSCDVVPTERKGPHIINDVRNVLDAGWDMMIAFPPCTHLARSGSRWWPRKQREQREAIEFVRTLYNAPIPRIAIENPRGVLSYKKPEGGYVFRMYDQIIQPWQFGIAENKATCLWLREIPPLMATLVIVGAKENRVHHEGPGQKRQANRSRTLPGIAAAMAAQWAA